MPKLGRLVKDLGGGGGGGERREWGGLEGIFHILRNMPASRAARNEHWGVRVLVGSNRKAHISNSYEEVLGLRSLLLLQTGGCCVAS